MSATSFHIDCVDGRAGGHKQPISFRSAEADIAADFGQSNLPDANSFTRFENVNSIISIADPASTRPDISVNIATDPIG
jgi:hypothetical protein